MRLRIRKHVLPDGMTVGQALGIDVKIDTCPKHRIKMTLELVQTGGCQCCGRIDTCYCDSPDVHAELFCPLPA